MTANLRKYEDYLYYMPEKERKALEEIIYMERGLEETDSLIRHINRKNLATSVKMPES